MIYNEHILEVIHVILSDVSRKQYKEDLFMAIIKCTDCGKDISDKAKKCPYCGKTFIEEVPLKF